MSNFLATQQSKNELFSAFAAQKFGFFHFSFYLCIRRNEKMNKEPKFKYQKQIDELLAIGCQLPELFAPNNTQACRFAFSEEGHQNHVPQYMSNPKRMLQDISKSKANTSLLALSCFTTSDKAETFYSNLRKAFKNVSTSIGDSLAEGILANEDGLKTVASTNGHFDFYEYESCDLNKTFQITKNLIETTDEKD